MAIKTRSFQWLHALGVRHRAFRSWRLGTGTGLGVSPNLRPNPKPNLGVRGRLTLTHEPRTTHLQVGVALVLPGARRHHVASGRLAVPHGREVVRPRRVPVGLGLKVH